MASVELAATAARDVALSSDGYILYATQGDGTLRAYDLRTGRLMESWAIGTKLGGLDMSPDGRFLMIVEEAPTVGGGGASGPSTATVYRFDLLTEQRTSYPVAISGQDSTFFDVAVLANGKVLLSQNVIGTDRTELKLLDPASGTYTRGPEVGQSSILSPSEDGSTVLIGEGNSPTDDLHIYDAQSGLVSSASADGLNLGIQALSSATGWSAQYVSNQGVRIYDEALGLQTTLTQWNSVSGLVFSPDGDFLYLLDDRNDAIVKLSVADWSVADRLRVEYDVGASPGTLASNLGNRLLIDPYGRYLTVITDSNVVIVENHDVPALADGLLFSEQIAGGAGDDTLRGFDGNDQISGYGGADTISGGNGDDVLFGYDEDPYAGAGVPSDGTDILSGGAGNDWIWGFTGDDRLDGGSGDDTLYGGSGNNRLISGAGVDLLSGGAGDDRLEFGGSFGAGDVAAGGDSSDTLVLDGIYSIALVAEAISGIETLLLASGGAAGYLRYNLTMNDGNVAAGQTMVVNASQLHAGETLMFYGGAERDGRFEVAAGGSNDTLFGGSGADVLNGGAGTDYLRGNAGADRLDGGAGVDDMAGGLGDDVYSVDQPGDIVTEHGGQGSADEIRTPLPDYTIADEVEILTGTGPNGQTLRGNAAANILNGGSGHDRLQLEQGGDDRASGGGGNDVIDLGAAFTAADRIDGGAGIDSLLLGGAYGAGIVFSAVTLINVEEIALGSAAGAGYFSYKLILDDANVAAGQTLAVDGRSLRLGEALMLYGQRETDGRFDIDAGMTNDVLLTGGGADTIRTGLGNDQVSAGAGDDIIDPAAGFTALDIFDGGAGSDTLLLAGNYGAGIALAERTLTNIERIDLASASAGSFFSYKLVTHDANVAADQTLAVDGSGLRQGETLFFYGQGETNGRFDLQGGASNDYLFGGTGADRLSGGLGIDYLAGGAGADVYAYAAAAESTGRSFDQIVGFDWNVDRIDLAGTVSGWDGTGQGTLRSASFDADLAAGINGLLDPNGAALFNANGGDMAGRAFLVVDANGDGSYAAGQDIVIQLTSLAAPLPGTAEFFV
jgi:Ca2+-binding RTX toxin-like protein